ncbi:MAG: DUF420 domain-containing protein [Myxococcaceae bacterium]|nr:DUF420 domain-containing protein [Myxococcaceae bacterium]
MSQLDPAFVASSSSSVSDRRFYVFTAVVSVLALGVLAWLLVVRKVDPSAAGADLAFMPAVNACFNAVSAILLTMGFIAIRRGNRRLHRQLMVSAFAASSLFLVGYLAYHSVHGDTKFIGQGAIRGLYFFILATHVLASMLVLPGALMALYFAWRKTFARHKRVTRVLLPIWLYVSVTGVVIYFMLRDSRAAAGLH